ncbi:MAG: hypothetical protein FWG88_04970 [Oscillospiraceae bacterium]|nr:hypothetical protein [Oscillospiraceae bacterium]
MHILYNGETYPIENFRPSASAVVWTGLHGLELPISGSIVTRRDEDLFALRSDYSADYERCIYDGSTLTLTNEPEPEPWEPEEELELEPTVGDVIKLFEALIGVESDGSNEDE